MSDGAMELLADPGMSVVRNHNQVEVKDAHTFAGEGIYSILIDLGGGNYAAYIGKSDKDIRHRMSGHESAARTQVGSSSQATSLVVRMRQSFPKAPVYKVVLIEYPERQVLMSKLKELQIAKGSIRCLEGYTDFDIRNTLCSLFEAMCVAHMCTYRGHLYMDKWRPPSDQ